MPQQDKFWDRIFSTQLVTCLAIGLAGCLAIYNATFHIDQPFRFVSRQLIWLSVSITLLYICSHISPAVYDRWTYPLTGIALVSLYALFFWGTNISGIQGWFTIDTKVLNVLYIQPAEIGKPIFVLFLAKKLAVNNRLSRTGFLAFTQYIALSLVWVVPLFLQSNLSSFLVYAMTFTTICWLQGAKSIQIALVLVVYLSFFVIGLRDEPLVHKRLLEYFSFITETDPDPSTNILQLKAALASGGLWGREPEQTFWSQHYVPLGYSDSIFATLGETIGFIGVLPIVLGIALWFIYCILVASKQDSQQQALIIGGIATMITVQAYIHISIALGIFPPVGIPLPMFSYGGGSLVSTMVSIGVILSLANNKREAIEIVDQ